MDRDIEGTVLTGGGRIPPPPPTKSMFPYIYRHVIHVITLFFHGEFDKNGFIPIQSDQDGLGRREQHPGGLQQDKT